LIANSPVSVPGIPPLEWIFRGMKVYDFDPHLLRNTIPIIGKKELEKDGGNLPLVIKWILDDPDKRDAFLGLVRDILPFVDDFAVEKFMDSSLLLKIREVNSGGRYFPAAMLSDGTINIAAIILALFFEERPVIVIEEPERNIHPYLIGKLSGMLQDAATRKQVIVTTHNPEMVKYVGINDLLLIARDREGYSRVQKPADFKEVTQFLEDEIGLDDLFVNNLLGLE
jgi:predicted ATPase